MYMERKSQVKIFFLLYALICIFTVLVFMSPATGEEQISTGITLYDWIKTKWLNTEYKTKAYIILTAVVALLFSAVILFSGIRSYKSGVSIAALTQRNSDAVPVNNGGIITTIDACPPFQWMGELPDVTVAASELPFQANGSYVVAGLTEDTCLRLIQAGFLFDTDYGGLALASKTNICFLYLNNKTLIAQIDDLEERDND